MMPTHCPDYETIKEARQRLIDYEKQLKIKQDTDRLILKPLLIEYLKYNTVPMGVLIKEFSNYTPILIKTLVWSLIDDNILELNSDWTIKGNKQNGY